MKEGDSDFKYPDCYHTVGFIGSSDSNNQQNLPCLCSLLKVSFATYGKLRGTKKSCKNPSLMEEYLVPGAKRCHPSA